MFLEWGVGLHPETVAAHPQSRRSEQNQNQSERFGHFGWVTFAPNPGVFDPRGELANTVTTHLPPRKVQL